MNVKINDATINRPEGERVLDGPAVLVNIEALVEQLKDESAWEKNDRNGITVFKTPGLTMVLSGLHKGAAMNDIQVEGLLVLQVIKGEISVSTNNEVLQVKKNQMLVLHPGATHHVVANDETMLLLSAVPAVVA